MPPRRERDDHGPKVPITWLGVETSEVPGVLCDQLGLPKGFGLVVDYVVPEGPAAAAGIQQNDVLKMYNDQILIDPSQLSKLVRSATDGTNVTLTVLRKGQEQRINVKLAKRDVSKRNAMSDPGKFNFQFGDMDMDELRDHLGELKGDLKEQLKGLQSEQTHDALMRARDEILKARDRVREATARARRGAEEARRDAGHAINIVRTDDGGVKTTRIDMGKAQVTFTDDKGELRIDNNDGKKIVTAKDPQGRLVWSGPADSKDDIDKMPPDVRDRYTKLQQNDLPAITNKSANVDDDADADDDQSDTDDDAPEATGAALEEVGVPASGHFFWQHGTIVS